MGAAVLNAVRACRDMVLDGECVACHVQTGQPIRSFNEITGPTKANGAHVNDKKFVAFDVVYAAGPGVADAIERVTGTRTEGSLHALTTEHRRLILEHFVAERCGKHFGVNPRVVVRSADMAERMGALQAYLNKSYDNDEEGLVVRNLNVPYGIGERNNAGFYKIKHEILRDGRGLKQVRPSHCCPGCPP